MFGLWSLEYDFLKTRVCKFSVRECVTVCHSGPHFFEKLTFDSRINFRAGLFLLLSWQLQMACLRFFFGFKFETYFEIAKWCFFESVCDSLFWHFCDEFWDARISNPFTLLKPYSNQNETNEWLHTVIIFLITKCRSITINFHL